MGPNRGIGPLTLGSYFKLWVPSFLGTVMFLLLFLFLLPLIHGAGGIHRNITDWCGVFLWIQDPRRFPGPMGPVLYGW